MRALEWTDTRAQHTGPHHNHHKASDSSVPTFLCASLVKVWTLAGSPRGVLLSDAESDGSMLRHERMIVAKALADHSSRGQKMARAGEEDLEVHCTSTFRTHPPPQAAGTVYYPMDVDDVPAAGGSWPDRLLDVSGPQERVLRRTVEQIVEPVRGVPVLDALVSQMVDQAAEVVRFFVSLLVVAEQVIEVPTVISERCSRLRSWRNSWWKCRRLLDLLGWREARALFEQLAAGPGRDTNTGRRDGG